jgi:hypothetical protein
MKTYRLWGQASKAVYDLKIKDTLEYARRYKEDARLPELPSTFYKLEWSTRGGWNGFLKIEKLATKYSTWLEASEAAKALDIKNSTDYYHRYRSDSFLPSKPRSYYKKCWIDNGSWDGFLCIKKIEPYVTLVEASNATISLGISTYKEYKSRFKEDPRLPSHPDKFYVDEWHTSDKWMFLFGRKVTEEYKSWELASNAIQLLGIKSAKEYRIRYKEDPKLPSKPERIYSECWDKKGKWKGFISQTSVYLTYEEASEAAIKLNIRSASGYLKNYKTNPRLPRRPENTYSSSWITKGGIHNFLGTTKTIKYSSWEEASSAAKKLDIDTAKKYYKISYQDPKLPYHPNRSYPNAWIKNNFWMGFLGKNSRKLYVTWTEASNAARKLNIKSKKEYYIIHKKDPSLPTSPSNKYSDVWKINGSWESFLHQETFKKYPSWTEASEAAIEIGIKSSTQYKSSYKNNPRLPANPDTAYNDVWKENKSWLGFLGHPNIEYYPSWELASEASVKLNIGSSYKYEKTFRKDSRLPRFPERIYIDNWKDNGSWDGFLKADSIKKYDSLKEVIQVIHALSIKSPTEYKLRYKEDPKLRGYPTHSYPKEMKEINGWSGIFPKNNLRYKTWTEASNAANKLGIKTASEYKIRYKLDELLPAKPKVYYSKDWNEKQGWEGFLNFQKITPYKTYSSASESARKLNIKSSAEYKSRHKEDPRLISNPRFKYEKEWYENSGWKGFLGVDKSIYPTWLESSNAAQALGITTKQQYIEQYTLDIRLRLSLPKIYKDDWKKNGSWDGFLMPREINSLEKASIAARYLGAISEKDYSQNYKNYPFGKLPRHPERSKFLNEDKWISWPHFLGVNFYTYNELIELIANTPEIKNSNTYKDYRISSKKIKMPASPEEFYDEWVNWFIALENSEPYQTRFIRAPHLSWRTSIDNFMKTARGAGQKINSLCKFERNFIEKENLGLTPQLFLLESGARTLSTNSTKTLLDKYKYFLDNITSATDTDTQYKVHQATCEFLEWVIVDTLSEDNAVGESIPLVTNPLKHINIKLKWGGWSKKTFETNKNILPYHYLKEARDWIIPTKARTLSDLKHLYNSFNSDWIRVDEIDIDKHDPDCVWELRPNSKFGPQYYLWSPVTWFHTYTLMQTPYRGYQIAYSDSGEADSEIPVTDINKNISWKANPGAMTGLTKNQGFIRKFPQDEIGTYLTTNKTHDHGAGYEIPWLDEDLAYWIIRLRSWQTKYNPIDKPTSWTELSRINLNEEQSKEKGSNCFLFRAHGQFEASSFQAYIDHRLAVSLYHTQGSIVELASVASDKKRSISNYKSNYSPHSIRASMITAFLMDFGLPPHIVMKIVGHATIVMTSYYNKPGKERLREIITIGEKKALQRKATNQMLLVQQGKLDNIKNEFTGNSKEVLASLSSSSPAANFTFTDYGFCPFAGARCNEGGLLIGNTKIYGNVPEGYLGKQNCLQCRFFVTGPAFLGGLLSIANELFFEAKKQSEHMEEIRISLETVKTELREFEKKQYDAEKYNKPDFDQDAKFHIEVHKNKLFSELERATKKIDMFLCDLNFSHKLINKCKDLVNHEELPHNENEIKLVKQQDFNLSIEPQETTHFHQLSEICSNAEFYESANAKSAIYPRSQMLDRMATLNGMDPILLMLNEKQQLVVGNQMSELLLSRLKSWGKIDKVISGNILLSDLNENQRITPLEIKELVNKKLGVNHEGS